MGSLFAGIGGIELGFARGWGKDFATAWAVELDSKACESYRANHKNKIINDDLANVELDKLEKIDILSAGFPCQAFSVAGYRLGFSDARGNVFFEILRYLRHFKPSVIFLENVKNLRGHDGGRTFRVIQDELENLGYKIKAKVLNTATHGNLPQNRERIYIVGFLDYATFENFSFPAAQLLQIKITELLESAVGSEFYYTHHRYLPKLKEAMMDTQTLYQWRRHYVRENKKFLCPTLTANMGTGGHNVPLVLCADGQIRKLTPRECARFQGFGDDFILLPNLSNATLYKQIGNSVSIGVIERIANEIKMSLEL